MSSSLTQVLHLFWTASCPRPPNHQLSHCSFFSILYFSLYIFVVFGSFLLTFFHCLFSCRAAWANFFPASLNFERKKGKMRNIEPASDWAERRFRGRASAQLEEREEVAVTLGQLVRIRFMPVRHDFAVGVFDQCFQNTAPIDLLCFKWYLRETITSRFRGYSGQLSFDLVWKGLSLRDSDRSPRHRRCWKRWTASLTACRSECVLETEGDRLRGKWPRTKTRQERRNSR